MPIYEKRTYDIGPAAIGQVVKLYRAEGWPAIEAGGFDDNLIGYFISDTGTLHQLVHIWRFDDDAARRAFWKRLFGDEAFLEFAAKIRTLIQKQDVQLLTSAPWGPTP